MAASDLIQAVLLALSTIAAYWTVREARRARLEENEARNARSNADRLVEGERRLVGVAEALVALDAAWGMPSYTWGDERLHQAHKILARQRLKAALGISGRELPHCESLLSIDDSNMDAPSGHVLVREGLDEIASALARLRHSEVLATPAIVDCP